LTMATEKSPGTAVRSASATVCRRRVRDARILPFAARFRCLRAREAVMLLFLRSAQPLPDRTARANPSPRSRSIDASRSRNSAHFSSCTGPEPFADVCATWKHVISDRTAGGEADLRRGVVAISAKGLSDEFVAPSRNHLHAITRRYPGAASSPSCSTFSARRCELSDLLDCLSKSSEAQICMMLLMDA